MNEILCIVAGAGACLCPFVRGEKRSWRYRCCCSHALFWVAQCILFSFMTHPVLLCCVVRALEPSSYSLKLLQFLKQLSVVSPSLFRNMDTEKAMSSFTCLFFLLTAKF